MVKKYKHGLTLETGMISQIFFINRMKKISVKDLVEFRRKSDIAKKIFVENVKSNKIEAPTEGGGNYWIAS